jgi:hypothetical protein
MANEFYVGIKTPKQLRKMLLTGSKNILEILKNSQELLDLRKEKLFVIDVLSQELAELNLLLEKLNEKFPKELLDDAPVRPVIPHHEKKKAPTLPDLKITEEPSDALGELEKIESALASVEEKLKFLD